METRLLGEAGPDSSRAQSGRGHGLEAADWSPQGWDKRHRGEAGPGAAGWRESWVEAGPGFLRPTKERGPVSHSGDFVRMSRDNGPKAVLRQERCWCYLSSVCL